MADYVDGLTDAELRTKLSEFGFPVVPITATTRKVMSKKLKFLIDNKNKVNSEGRRSLAKYSSEEESDGEVKAKRDKIRRQTVAAVMQPPAVTKSRKSVRVLPREETVAPPQASTVNTEVKTTSRRTTRIIKPVEDADFETGSDSEPEIVEYVNSTSKTNVTESKAPDVSYTSYIKPISSIQSPRSPMLADNHRQSPLGADYSAPRQVSSSSFTRYTTSTHNSHDGGSGDSVDKLNQIRSRLSLGGYDRPTFGGTVDRKVIGSSGTSYGDNDLPSETPFLSNFTKRLSQLSSTSPTKSDYGFKNDIIKEHDSNGSSYDRLYLSRARKRDFPQDFKSSQEKNIFKNNFVSFALLGIVVAFFIAIFVMYMGIRTEHLPAVLDSSDYVLPLCTDGDHMSKPGINCVPQSEITDTLNLLKVLQPELTKRSLNYHCNDMSYKPYMTDSQIIDYVSQYYAPRNPYHTLKDINNLQVLAFKNPKWGISVIDTDTFPADTQTLENIDHIFNNRKSKNLAMIILNPDIPWRCFIFNKLYTVISSLFIIGLGFSIIFGIQRGYKYHLKQCKSMNDQIFSMVEKIIDILQTNASDNSDNFLAVNHVRDMIMPPQDRKQLAFVWNGAVKFLQENESRVRTEVQIVAGEEFHVWRWLGNANMNLSGSPKSKIWQGQAFETQVGSVNSLPCSPTPCLKVRGMFDERERNHFTIREAVLSKCAGQCKILHCEVDLKTSCVYLKCANQSEAAIAYRNLHGWWYDGNLLTVKYLRLERYMQRFPDSPAKGPPFLQASSNLSVANDWASNDD